MLKKSTANKTIPIEIAYAEPERQYLWEIFVSENATMEQTLELAKEKWIVLQSILKETNHQKIGFGIFGIQKNLSTPLKAGDRIEIYRPLLEDPKIRRQEQVKASKKKARQAKSIQKEPKRMKKIRE
ncbi:MAG: RnfH family protein [Gammaproteobacteria bacterium]